MNISLPKSSWAYAGYATPADTLQTALWAQHDGDMKSLVASLTPEFVQKTQKEWGDQFEDKLKSFLPTGTEWVTNCTIQKMEVISGNEVNLTFRLKEAPHLYLGKEVVRVSTTGIRLKRLGDEWKLDP